MQSLSLSQGGLLQRGAHWAPQWVRAWGHPGSYIPADQPSLSERILLGQSATSLDQRRISPPGFGPLHTPLLSSPPPSLFSLPLGGLCFADGSPCLTFWVESLRSIEMDSPRAGRGSGDSHVCLGPAVGRVNVAGLHADF